MLEHVVPHVDLRPPGSVEVCAQSFDPVGPVQRPEPRLTLASLTSISELHLTGAIAGIGQPIARLRCIEGLQSTVEQAVLSGRSSVGLGDIADEPLVGFSRDAELQTTLDRELASARQLRAPDLIVDRFRTALSLVAAGPGVMVVPSIAAGAVPTGAKLVDLDHPDLHRTIGVLRRPDTTTISAFRPLVDRLIDAVSRIPGVELD